jgi:hypothetical protein
MKNRILLLCTMVPFLVRAQTNITVTNTTAANILKGNYNAASYNPSGYSRLPTDIIQGLQNNVNADSIKAYWTKLGTFYNRSSGNQLASTTRGITATFGWVASKFREFSGAAGNRLVVSDLTFSQSICSMSNHRETFAVLPGNDLSDKSVLVFLAHADTRTNVSCPGSSVVSKGMEDNATGVSLVMELARVMSRYSYKKTIVFMITTAEEQGLYGSSAFAKYLHNNSIPVKAVYNNDIVGSIQCILPTNAVGCTVNNSIDSVSVRLFSGGGTNSSSKGWARYIKMQYTENLKPLQAVSAKINVMTEIDRTSRSGDHVPFYNLGDIAVRMCSFNEPGDGGGSGREHLSADSGGVDINKDGTLDSFFVSFSFLKRNAQIDGNAVAMAALAPATPTYSITNIGNNRLRVVISTQQSFAAYRLGIRTTTYDFDSVYTFTRKIDTLQMPVSANGQYYASVAVQDSYGVESFFGNEVTLSGTSSPAKVAQMKASPVQENDVLVQWKVDNTDMANTFVVERSDDNMHFEEIGKVKATSSYVYQFHDRSPLSGENYYRLRMVGTTQSSFSQVAKTQLPVVGSTRVVPSPAHDFFIIKTKATGKTAQLTDLQGRRIKNLVVADGMQVDISTVPPGMYLLKLSNGEVVKFSKE